MSRYREQLARLRRGRRTPVPTPVRRVRVGETFDLAPDEVVQVGQDINGMWLLLCTIDGGPGGMKGARVG